MYYYFKNEVHRNIHIYTHDICDSKCEAEKGKFIVAFQTNWTNNWYYLNEDKTIGQMRYATKAKRFDNERDAYEFMVKIFHNLQYQGVDKIME